MYNNRGGRPNFVKASLVNLTYIISTWGMCKSNKNMTPKFIKKKGPYAIYMY